MSDFSFDRHLYVNNCGREACERGHRFGPALRGYHLMHIVASGCGVFDNGARRYEVRPGQGFMIFPDDVTVYTADGESPWDYVWVGFSGEGAASLANSAGLTPQNPVFDLGRYAEIALRIAYSIYDDMSLLQQPAPAALGGLLRLMAYVAQSRYDASPQRRASAGADSFQRAMWMLNAHYQRADFRIEDVASFVGLSRSQLFRVFKAQCGRSPQAVLGELRLSHAKRLLSATELSLTEAALSSGFSSAARLGEVFRAELGISPTAYRSAARGPQRDAPAPPAENPDCR
ncbi:MAG: AraC family transcriptional regulator [Clostridia bacterium]|nr:AraC family transcriptional regulator [Clostridia bacterium]